MRVWSKAIDCFFTGPSVFMISLGDNIEPDFTPKGCWTSCSKRACHYWPLQFAAPPYQRVRWRGEERLGEKWLSFFPSADEVCLNSRGLKDLIFPWNYFSLVIRHHLVFQIVISSHQFYLRKMYGMYGIVFSSIFWRLWLYLFSEKCPDA